jgi:hypothetical protein
MTRTTTEDDAVPEEEIDANLVPLVKVLNSLPCVTTVCCCGGHPGERDHGKWPEGTWYVTLEIAQKEQGWRMLAFLGWAITASTVRQDITSSFTLTPCRHALSATTTLSVFSWRDTDTSVLKSSRAG